MDLDPVALLAALGVNDATRITPVQGGWDTALWRVERPGCVQALRVFRPEQAETCRREVLAMRAAADAGVPVPSVDAEGCGGAGRGSPLGRDGDEYSHPSLLLSWCAGQPLLEDLRARPWRVWRLGVQFGQMQARIHAVPVPEALRRHSVDWISWAGPDEEALRRRLRALRPGLVRPGPEGAPRPCGDALLHLDYHPLNVLTDGERMTAVLDWANVGVGDPRADVARTYTILRVLPNPPDAPPLVTTVLRFLLERAWRSGYEQVAGPLHDMPPFYIWAGMVMVRDLAPKVGRPGVWLTMEHLDAVRRWTAKWEWRAE